MELYVLLSVLFSSGESDKTLNSETSNFININLNCSYLNLLWVEKQLGHFEEKFSDPFLTENGIVW